MQMIERNVSMEKCDISIEREGERISHSFPSFSQSANPN
jgi:hypothetical protein